ncbi:hypothetical protein M422DRAFT_45255 [Sphaerobolus stellatus SS14]|nr:hypothetical protein M422DRAFT_45255 [Sphaerobolus stellatus SS14]
MSFSSAKYYDPYNPDEHVPTDHDELGIIRSIAVKVKSFSKRKELFLKVQRDCGSDTPCMIPLDMVVCWSSNHRLVDLRIKLKDEKDSSQREKLEGLRITNNEWANLKEFCDVLDICAFFLAANFLLNLSQISDVAQQVFSSETYLTLYLVIPALEAIHAGLTHKWCEASEKIQGHIDAGTRQVVEYYNKTSASDAYLVSMGKSYAYLSKITSKHDVYL